MHMNRRLLALAVITVAGLALGGCSYNPWIPEVEIADEPLNLIQNPSGDQGTQHWSFLLS